MSEAKTLSLTIGERVKALGILDGFKGSLATLATLLEDVKQFVVTDEEWTAADLVKTPTPDGKETWKWNESAPEKEVTIQAPTVDVLKADIKTKSDANELTIADVALVSLDKKLNA